MDETGRTPPPPSTNARPSAPARPSRAAVALALISAAALSFVAGWLAAREWDPVTPTGPASDPREAPATRATTAAVAPGDEAAAPVDLPRVAEHFHATKLEVDRMTSALEQQLLRGDRESAEVHRARGEVLFDREIPEIVSFREHSFLRAVEAANRRAWFADPAALGRANTAWAKTLAHAHRLDPDQGDSAYRALDDLKASLHRDRNFREYVHEALFARPYLIFRADGERVASADLDRLPRRERSRALAEMEARRATHHRALAERALIYRQLYAEFLRRYGEDCDLEDLMTPWGGRGDLPIGKRSFRDGYALPVWVFSTRSAFERHFAATGDPIARSVAGIFRQWTGLVLVSDEPDDRRFELESALSTGAHQLVAAFRRQKLEWGSQGAPVNFFEKAFAHYMGGADMAQDRTLTFHGLSADYLSYGKAKLEEHDAQSKRFPVVPAEDLVSFEDLGYFVRRSEPKIPGDDRELFFVQSWALVHYLNEANDGRLEPQFRRFLRAMLSPHEPREHFVRTKFAEAFGLRTEADWFALDSDFRPYYLRLLRAGPEAVSKPPSLDDWPGYVTPRSLDPDSPDVTAGEELVPRAPK